MFRKQIVLLFVVAFLIITQTSCTLDKPQQYQTSVGIIQRAEEIEQSGTYKMGWLSEDILEKLLEEDFEKLLSGSRYYFIPTSDLSTVEKLVKIENVRCYPLSPEDILLGVIMDTADIDAPLLIPVCVMPVFDRGGETESALEKIMIEPNHLLLLRFVAAAQISRQIQSDLYSFINNLENRQVRSYADMPVKTLEKYTVIAALSEGESITEENVLAVAYCNLLTKPEPENVLCNAIATTLIMPRRDISVVSYGSTLRLLDKGEIIATESCKTEESIAKSEELKDVLCQRGDADMCVPYNYTWHNQKFIKVETEESYAWDSTIVHKKKNAAYCFATEFVISVDHSDDGSCLEEALSLRLDKVTFE